MDDPYWEDDEDWDDEDYCPGCGEDSYWCDCDDDDDEPWGNDDDYERMPHKHVYWAWAADPRFGICACGEQAIIG